MKNMYKETYLVNATYTPRLHLTMYIPTLNRNHNQWYLQDAMKTSLSIQENLMNKVERSGDRRDTTPKDNL